MAIPRWLTHILAHYNVPFEVHHHPPTYTASELAEAEHITGYRVAKTVFLTCQGRPIAVVLPSCRRLDLERVKAVLGQDDLRLATEAEIAGWFKGCEPGAVPPLQLRQDERILMDRSLAHLGPMLIPAGTLEDAMVVPFRAWFRAVRPGVGHFAAPKNGESNGKAPQSILVVEDEAATNDLFCQLLQREGYTCQAAGEGKGALDLAPQMKPSAILLDLMLPDMSGFEMVEQLRRTGPLKRIPIIVVTALDDAACRQRGQQLGADAYLTKPFVPATLVEEINEVLEPV
jgi:Ala-tRNA(Pro) deacylase